MHDCRLNGGHFFVYKPQNHEFRCRRCSECFISSYTDAIRKHPWICLIERCEYVACDPCSSILVEELAIATSQRDDTDRVPLESLGNKEVEGEEGKDKEDEDEKGRAKKMPQCGMMESDRTRDVTKALMLEVQEPEIIEADDSDNGTYKVPTLICKTARQAAAQAAMKRAHVKAGLTRRGGGGDW